MLEAKVIDFVAIQTQRRCARKERRKRDMVEAVISRPFMWLSLVLLANIVCMAVVTETLLWWSESQ